MQPLEYWFISLPFENDSQTSIARLESQLKENVESRQMGKHFVLSNIPTKKLRVGTLDNLISLSDELGKIDNFGKTVVQKLHRTYIEQEEGGLANKSESESKNKKESNKASQITLDVYKKPIKTYICEFAWDEGHFDTQKQLRELVTKIHANLLKTAEALRKITNTLSEVNSKLQAIKRKQTGTLMNRSLQGFIKHEQWVKGEYIISAMVVLPKNKKQEFLECYQFLENSTEAEKLENAIKQRQEEETQMKEKNENETELSSNDNDSHRKHSHHLQENHNELNILKSQNVRTVVPDSAMELHEDDEFVLYRVVVLKKGYEWFKLICREKGYNVRDFDFDDEESKDDKQQAQDLEHQKVNWEKKLKNYCSKTFSETFANWIHLKIIRVFVESVLRFGLPVRFSINVISPSKGNEKRLLKTLEKAYAHLTDRILQQPGGENEIDFSGLGTDFYPFVYVPCHLDLQ